MIGAEPYPHPALRATFSIKRAKGVLTPADADKER
jgi:hypothetical protein